MLVLMALFVLSGCAQRETDVGSSAIPVSPGGTEGRTIVSATRSGEWDVNLSAGRGATLQIGEVADFKVVSALRFEPNEILPDSFTIDTARIKFRVDRVYPGRGNAPDLRMLIKQVTDSWSEDSLREGALANRASYPVIDTLLLPTNVNDTLPIYWQVPDSIWATWLLDDSLNFGLLLEAENPGVMVGVQTSEGATDFTVQLEMNGTQFPEDSGFAANAWSDTLLPIDDGYLAVDSSESRVGRLRVSQGSYRRALLYFPLDSVTVNPLRTVVRAWIHFYADLDAPNSITYTGSNFLYKDASLVDTTWFQLPDSTKQNFIALSSTAFNADNREISFDVTNSLAGMVGRPETNGGFSIQASLESDVVSRQFFHSFDSEVDSLRPRLEIWWIEP